MLRKAGPRKPLPLSGRTVILTRPRSQGADMARALRAAGARVVSAPAIRIEPPRAFGALDRALRGLARFDAVVFASANACDRFFARARALRLGKLTRPRRLFAVGPGTARSLERQGWTGAFVPRQNRAEGLARRLAKPRGLRILIPRAAEGREALPRLLRESGAKVTVAACYRTLPDPAGLGRLIRETSRARKGMTALAFASPSAALACLRALGPARARAFFRRGIAAALGPVTAEALRAAGIEPRAQAARPTAEALIRALSAAHEPR